MPKPNVTMQEIADRLGVSLKSVSLAVNGTGRLSQKTRERILQAAREMGYRPNFAARSLVTRRSCLIGVLLPYSNSSFFGDIMTGIEKKAHEHGFMLLLGNPSGGARNCGARFSVSLNAASTAWRFIPPARSGK